MKRIILLILTLSLGVITFSQGSNHLVNRYNNRLNDRIPYDNMKLTYSFYTDQIGNDSITMSVIQYNNTYIITMTDSCTFGKPNNASNYVGDILKVIAKGSSGTILKFNPTYFKSLSPAATRSIDRIGYSRFTLSTQGRAVIVFVFDGVYWVQVSEQLL